MALDLTKSFAKVPAAEPEQVEIEQAIANKATTSPAAGRKPQKMGKSRNPDFKRLVVLVRKDTEKAALRLLMDQPGVDLSDLIERLLSTYVHKHLGT